MSPKSDDCDFLKCFHSGEAEGRTFIGKMIGGLIEKYPHKDQVEKRLQDFSALMAGFLSSSLYQTYVELDRSLRDSGGIQENAELLVQKVFTIFASRLVKDKRPIECKFAISRKKK